MDVDEVQTTRSRNVDAIRSAPSMDVDEVRTARSKQRAKPTNRGRAQTQPHSGKHQATDAPTRKGQSRPNSSERKGGKGSKRGSYDTVGKGKGKGKKSSKGKSKGSSPRSKIWKQSTQESPNATDIDDVQSNFTKRQSEKQADGTHLIVPLIEQVRNDDSYIALQETAPGSPVTMEDVEKLLDNVEKVLNKEEKKVNDIEPPSPQDNSSEPSELGTSVAHNLKQSTRNTSEYAGKKVSANLVKTGTGGSTLFGERESLAGLFQKAHDENRIPAAINEDGPDNESENGSVDEVNDSRSIIKCKYGATCRNKQCPYSHTVSKPSVTDDVSVTTTNCKYGAKCRDKNCKFSHAKSEATEPSAASVQGEKEMCKFGVTCRSFNCKFNHPEGYKKTAPAQCRAGADCKNAKCTYSHPPKKTGFFHQVANFARPAPKFDTRFRQAMDPMYHSLLKKVFITRTEAGLDSVNVDPVEATVRDDGHEISGSKLIEEFKLDTLPEDVTETLKDVQTHSVSHIYEIDAEERFVIHVKKPKPIPSTGLFLHEVSHFYGHIIEKYLQEVEAGNFSIGIPLRIPGVFEVTDDNLIPHIPFLVLTSLSVALLRFSPEQLADSLALDGFYFEIQATDNFDLFKKEFQYRFDQIKSQVGPMQIDEKTRNELEIKKNDSYSWIRTDNKGIDRLARLAAAFESVQTIYRRGYQIGNNHPEKLRGYDHMMKGTRIMDMDEALDYMMTKKSPGHKTQFYFMDGDVQLLTAMEVAKMEIEKDPMAKVVALSAASRYHCGGGFGTGGRHALEESWCMISTLYPSLLKATHLAEKLPEEEKIIRVGGRTFHAHIPELGCIVSPHVDLFREQFTDGYRYFPRPLQIRGIVSIAAFNRNPKMADSPMDAPEDENEYQEMLTAKWLVAIVGALQLGAEVLIIPDVGCGVFQNDPVLTGQCLNDALIHAEGFFKEVIILGKSEFSRAAIGQEAFRDKVAHGIQNAPFMFRNKKKKEKTDEGVEGDDESPVVEERRNSLPPNIRNLVNNSTDDNSGDNSEVESPTRAGGSLGEAQSPQSEHGQGTVMITKKGFFRNPFRRKHKDKNSEEKDPAKVEEKKQKEQNKRSKLKAMGTRLGRKNKNKPVEDNSRMTVEGLAPTAVAAVAPPLDDAALAEQRFTELVPAERTSPSGISNGTEDKELIVEGIASELNPTSPKSTTYSSNPVQSVRGSNTSKMSNVLSPKSTTSSRNPATPQSVRGSNTSKGSKRSKTSSCIKSLSSGRKNSANTESVVEDEEEVEVEQEELQSIQYQKMSAVAYSRKDAETPASVMHHGSNIPGYSNRVAELEEDNHDANAFNALPNVLQKSEFGFGINESFDGSPRGTDSQNSKKSIPLFAKPYSVTPKKIEEDDEISYYSEDSVEQMPFYELNKQNEGPSSDESSSDDNYGEDFDDFENISVDDGFGLRIEASDMSPKLNEDNYRTSYHSHEKLKSAGGLTPKMGKSNKMISNNSPRFKIPESPTACGVMRSINNMKSPRTISDVSDVLDLPSEPLVTSPKQDLNKSLSHQNKFEFSRSGIFNTSSENINGSSLINKSALNRSGLFTTSSDAPSDDVQSSTLSSGSELDE